MKYYYFLRNIENDELVSEVSEKTFEVLKGYIFNSEMLKARGQNRTYEVIFVND
jgi:hypothetical protein